MSTRESLVRNISDTALLAAIYRARETERPDAVFRDPFARRLAGERGDQIAKSMPFSERATWAWITRTYAYDEFIKQQVMEGVDMVVNLAAGLDARPYRMNLPASLRWTEVDLPGILDYKEEILRGEKPACILDRVRLDLSDVAARRQLFAALGGSAKSVLIITEGLLIYFSREEVASLAQDLAAVPAFHHWIVDIASPGLLKMLQKGMGEQIREGKAEFKFAPEEGPRFFTGHGWDVVDVRSTLKTAARLKRLTPLDAPSLFLARFEGQARLPPVVRHLPAPQSIRCTDQRLVTRFAYFRHSCCISRGKFCPSECNQFLEARIFAQWIEHWIELEQRRSEPATAGKLLFAAKAGRPLATADVRARGTVCRDHSH